MQLLKKIILWTLLGLLFLGILGIGISWLTLRASLPQLSGTIEIEGLSSTVTIERDDAGIPTIQAANREDLAYGTGFVHGQDRFFQMDLIRRQAAGELSALFGPLAVNVDKASRFHRFRARAREVLESTPQEHLAILEHYTAGVNTGLKSLKARPFEYFILRAQPEPWRNEDSLLVLYAMFLQLNDSMAWGEIRRSKIRHALPEELYEWIYQLHSPWDAPLIGGPSTSNPIPPASVVSLRGLPDSEKAADETGPGLINGSNNWAVAGRLTESGRALVSNDMHLGLSVPNIFSRARLVQTGSDPRDVSGVILPGTPIMVAGSNTYIAWGNTNSQGDFTDAVLIRPGSEKDTYKTQNGDRTFEVFTEIIEVKGEEPVEFKIRETIWGPVNERAHLSEGEVAVSWIAHKTEATNFNLIDFETVTTAKEALDLANTMGIPPQNLVVGDVQGNIGWTIAGRIPAKSGIDGRLPADWSSEAGWQGWVKPENYPRVYNPESGRLWTANSRVVDGEALTILGDGDYDHGARTKQIRDGLFARDQFAPQDMLDIQMDDRAVFMTPWRDLLLSELNKANISEDEELAEYKALIENWIPRASPDSVGFRLVRAFRIVVANRIHYALMTPVREASDGAIRLRPHRRFETALWSAVSDQPEHLLPGDYPNWNAFFISAIKENIHNLNTRHAGGLSQRTWGEFNKAAIKHPLSGALPFLSSWLDMPADELSGDSFMPKAQSRGTGASERFSVSPGDEANGILHMPTGQSGHPMSEYYRNGHQDWIEGNPTPFLPGDPVNVLTLTPETE